MSCAARTRDLDGEPSSHRTLPSLVISFFATIGAKLEWWKVLIGLHSRVSYARVATTLLVMSLEGERRAVVPLAELQQG